MTMFSLVVSVTFVILTLAANQLGPRLIPTFMSYRQIQTVLGLFPAQACTYWGCCAISTRPSAPQACPHCRPSPLVEATAASEAAILAGGSGTGLAPHTLG
jgi:hypothetical protein